MSPKSFRAAGFRDPQFLAGYLQLTGGFRLPAPLVLPLLGNHHESHGPDLLADDVWKNRAVFSDDNSEQQPTKVIRKKGTYLGCLGSASNRDTRLVQRKTEAATWRK